MPFGPYRDFDDCVAKNRDKRNPRAYCGSIQSQVEGAADLRSEFKVLKVGKASGVAEIPRDYHGRWCKGVGCEEGTGAVIETEDPAVFAKISPENRVSAPDEWFASDSEFAAARAHADQKARDVPKPTAKQIAANKRAAAKAKAGQGRAGGELRGSSFARRERGEALFEEFGGHKHGYVPCVHCGLKVSPGGRGGHAAMEQDKILTLNEGGKYGTAKSGFPNLIPSCSGCNKHRGETPYPVRPAWEKPKHRHAIAASAGAHSSLIGEVVVGFPLNWNDPEADGIGRPVQGVLFVRTVDTWFGPYEQWIVGGEVVDPMSVTQPEALVASIVPDGDTVRAMAVGWDGRLSDDTDWALDRSDLPLLTVQIGTLVITHVEDLGYDQYSVNGIPVDPHTIQPVTLGVVASVCDRCGLPRRRDEALVAAAPHGVSPMWAGHDVPRDPEGKWCKGAQCQGDLSPSDQLLTEHIKETMGEPGDLVSAEELIGTGPLTGKLLPVSGGDLENATQLYEAGGMSSDEYSKVVDSFIDAHTAQEVADYTGSHTMPTYPGNTVNTTPAAYQAFLDGKISSDGKPITKTPLSYEQMSPGQKAAYTKKQNKIAADKAAQAKTLEPLVPALETINDQYVTDSIDKGRVIDDNRLTIATEPVLDHYIQTNFKAKGPPPGSTVEQKRNFVKLKNAQHLSDQTVLVGDLGYASSKTGGPRDARRSVLRETGQRRITGGPKSDTSHEFLTEDQINAMPRDKLLAAVIHHDGGNGSLEQYDTLSDLSLRKQLSTQNSTYRDNVAKLQVKGYSDDQIPHGYRSSQRVVDGWAPGFQHDGKYGPTVEPHGPLAPKPIVKPTVVIKQTSIHPSGWEHLSPGQKAAWTKTHGGKQKIQLDAPHPAEWESWGPGKKAAWTKKHNVGGVVTTHGTLGEHTTITATGTYDAHNKMSAQISKHPAPSSSGYELSRHDFHNTLNDNDKEAMHAVSSYAGIGYGHMNKCLRYHECSDYSNKEIEDMRRAFNFAPAHQPSIVERGKNQSKGGFKEFGWQVGGVYPDAGFWSSSVHRGVANDAFGDRVYMRVHTNGVRGIPGNEGEYEWIYPPGTKFRVLGIVDVIADDGKQYRYVEAEMVP